MTPKQAADSPVRPLPKVRTGIGGLDEVTQGGLPKGRPTLVCGSSGCGKTLLAMEFLIRGVTEFGEPGVFMAFEETKQKLAANVASLGFDLDRLIAQKKLVVDYVHVDQSEIEETGEYDLGGLFARLEHHVKTTKAKRVVLDTIEVLFGGLKNEGIIRSELRRLFRWLEDHGLTAVITAERADGQLTRHGLEEYVSDCVILLDHRVSEGLSTRRIRIVKYRGSDHGTNEYPFLIDEHGISVMPLSTIGLDHPTSDERVSSGVPELDEMLGKKGYFRGSSVLLSGTAGTGKSILAASFATASCERGDPTLYFSMEESRSQIFRNMKSLGLSLERWSRKGLLRIHASRPSEFSLEMHLVNLHKHVNAFKAKAVIFDPVTSLLAAGNPAETRSLLVRLIDLLKSKGITALLTSLSTGADPVEASDVGISSLIDTWITLGDTRVGGERNRIMQIIKSRGMAHSNQIREFVLSEKGLQLLNVYLGAQGVLTGSARLAQEARDQLEESGRLHNAERESILQEIEEKSLAAQIAALQVKLQALGSGRETLLRVAREREGQTTQNKAEMAVSRKENLDDRKARKNAR